MATPEPSAWALLASAREREISGDAAGATRALDRALSLGPDLAPVVVDWASARLDGGDPVAARRALVLGGPYRFVRHPMYLGYLVTHLAVIGMNPASTNLALYAACWLCQVPRLLAEERLLGEDPAYQAYRGAVRWRLLPGLW